MSGKRPFRFGLVAGSAPTRAEWLALVHKTENLGYNTFLITDHYVNEFPPLVALMAAADASNTMRIGTFVFDNDFRHPALLAKELATLDLLSSGRVEVGIGAGWHESEYAQVGLPFDDPGTRIERLEEALQILKQFFTQETVQLIGKHYAVNNLQAMPKVVQKPRPPIFIGGGGKKMLSLAAREADIVGIHLKAGRDGSSAPSEHTEEALAQKIAWVRQAAGERFPDLELNMLIRGVAITDNRQRAAEEYMLNRGRAGLTAEQHLANPYLFLGSQEQIIAQVERLREQFGISYFVVGHENMDAFAPIVSHLSGK